MLHEWRLELLQTIKKQYSVPALYGQWILFNERNKTRIGEMSFFTRLCV